MQDPAWIGVKSNSVHGVESISIPLTVICMQSNVQVDLSAFPLAYHA